MESFDMFADQTEIGEPGEHDLGLDNASEEAFYDPPPYEPPRNIISPDRSPIGQAFDAVIGLVPDPTTLKGAFDLGLTAFSLGSNKAAIQAASYANTMLSAANRAGRPDSTAKGFTGPGPHPDEGTPYDPQNLVDYDTLVDLAYGAAPPSQTAPIAGLPDPNMLAPPSAPPAPVATPPQTAVASGSRPSNMVEPPADAPVAQPSLNLSPMAPAPNAISAPAHSPTPNTAPQNVATLDRQDVAGAAAQPPGGETGVAIDNALDSFGNFVSDVFGAVVNAPAAVANTVGGLMPGQYAGANTAPSGKHSPFGPPTETAYRDPDPESNDPPPPMMPLGTTPAAPAPVAEGPSFAPAPTTGLMALPPGFDPTQAGYTYTNFARTAQRGGLMDLPNQARNVAAQGRGGDTMLVHMRPDEVAGLQALGGVTRNPQTGLPEHFMGSLLGSLAGLAFAPFTGGMSAFAAQGLGAGLGQFAESKIRGEDNALTKGLTSGLLAGLGSWGLNKLGSAATTAGQSAIDTATQKAGETALTEAQKATIRSQGEGFLAGAQNYFPKIAAPGAVPGPGTIASNVLPGMDPLMGAAGMGLGAGAVTDMMMPYVPQTKEPGEFKSTAKLDPRYQRTARENLSGVDLTNYGQGPERRFFSTQKFQEGGLTEVGAMMQEAGPDADIVAQEVTAQAVSAVRGDHPEPEKAVTEYISMFGQDSFGRLREMVIQEMQVESVGGAQETAAEGMISGPGAGRDDLIRGSIEGEQELRVSDGEFIIPADVVSGIGDGSSDAGAKRLYQMLDRVRQTRTGTKRQPSRVDEQAMLPA